MEIISILVSEDNVVFFKSVTLTVPFFFSAAVLSEVVSNESDEAATLIYENMAAWVINEGVHSYSEPNTTNISYSVEWMHKFAIDPSRLNDAPEGWLPVRGTGNNISRYGGGPVPNAWVRRDDVVLGENLKKVIGCWPIKNLKYEPGDYSMHIKFNPDGTGVADGIDNFPELRHVTEPSVQVYMEKSLVIIAYSQHGLRVPVILIAGYRSEEAKLFPDGVPSHEQERFSKAELEGCANTPTLE